MAVEKHGAILEAAFKGVNEAWLPIDGQSLGRMMANFALRKHLTNVVLPN
jgi:hypothetical protein